MRAVADLRNYLLFSSFYKLYSLLICPSLYLIYRPEHVYSLSNQIRLIRAIRVQKIKIVFEKIKFVFEKIMIRVDKCSMHRVTCHTCNLCVCARTHPRARMRIFYKVN